MIKIKVSHLKLPDKKGLFIMLFACLLFSVMNISVYAISREEIGVSSVVISFFRVFVNWLFLVIPALFKKGEIRKLFGDCRKALWMRGLFGATALMLSFAAIARIGPGESAFLAATSGVFVALFSPWILGQRNSLLAWLAIIGSFGGVYLLFKGNGDSHNLVGRAMGLGAGFLSAMAYLMVARAGRSNPIKTVIFYFCFVSILLHIGYFVYYGYQIPNNLTVWGLLVFTGLVGTGAQYGMTRAYQTSPAALVSAVGYLVPVLSLIWGAILFAHYPSESALTGAGLILLFGVLLPFRL